MADEVKRRASLFAPLDEYHRQIEALRAEGRELIEGLDHAQFNWSPAPGKWSIGQCVSHLDEVASLYCKSLDEALPKAVEKNLYGDTGRYNFLERWFVRQMEPPPKQRVRAPGKMRPVPELDPEEGLRLFLASKDRIVDLIWRYNGIDLARAKIRNPILRFVKTSAGAAFAGIAAHERRHLWQARQILQQPGFPTSP